MYDDRRKHQEFFMITAYDELENAKPGNAEENQALFKKVAP